jgi:hypothetical protein
MQINLKDQRRKMHCFDVNLQNLMVAANQHLGFIFFNNTRYFFVFLSLSTGIHPMFLKDLIEEGKLLALNSNLHGVFHRLFFDKNNDEFKFYDVEFC